MPGFNQFIMSILTVLFSGCLAALVTRYLNTNYERSRILNKVIYDLLDVYVSLHVFSKKDDLVKKAFGGLNQKTDPKIYSSASKQIGDFIRNEAVKSLIQNQNHINDLATIDPLGALELKGIIVGLEQTMNIGSSKTVTNQEIEKITENLSEAIQDYILKRLLPHLKKIIINLSKMVWSKKSILKKLSEIDKTT